MLYSVAVIRLGFIGLLGGHDSRMRLGLDEIERRKPVHANQAAAVQGTTIRTTVRCCRFELLSQAAMHHDHGVVGVVSAARELQRSARAIALQPGLSLAGAAFRGLARH